MESNYQNTFCTEFHRWVDCHINSCAIIIRLFCWTESQSNRVSINSRIIDKNIGVMLTEKCLEKQFSSILVSLISMIGLYVGCTVPMKYAFSTNVTELHLERTGQSVPPLQIALDPNQALSFLYSYRLNCHFWYHSLCSQLLPSLLFLWLSYDPYSPFMLHRYNWKSSK